jgi:hypothetical protein
MKNRFFNTYPTRVAAAVAAGMPAWWTPADEVDRNAARLGCKERERDCGDCRVASCPEARRMCRVCAEWRSGSGVAGVCAINGNVSLPVHTCGKWRALA